MHLNHKSLLVLLGLFIGFSFGSKAQQPAALEKIEGFAFYGPKTPGLSHQPFDAMRSAGANWVAVVPELVLNRFTLSFQPDSLNEHWGETIEASLDAIQLAKAAGLKVMLKPHMVLIKSDDYNGRQRELQSAYTAAIDPGAIKDRTRGADWRGAFYPGNKMDRERWENNYREYILKLAVMAETNAVDLFCIGTELKKSAIRHPEYWRSLIKEVRQIYTGPITYSANWDEYDRIRFWSALDYIGVNTYFPVNAKKKPGVLRSRRKWRKIRNKLRSVSTKEQKLVLFTEFGYRNVYYAGRRPWEHDDDKAIAFDAAQANLYQAFFKSFWQEDWVAGGFSWKWFADIPKAGNTTFSIQGKPAFDILRAWYTSAINEIAEAPKKLK